MSDLSDLSLSDLLSMREAARAAFASAQAAAAKGIAAHMTEAVTILGECARAMRDIGFGDADYDEAVETIRSVMATLAGDDSEEVSDADD